MPASCGANDVGEWVMPLEVGAKDAADEDVVAGLLVAHPTTSATTAATATTGKLRLMIVAVLASLVPLPPRTLQS